MGRNVTLRQLRAFSAVARARSFTRAAEVLNVTQSAVTVAIRSLEAELGLRLLDRTTRSLQPTPHGERLLQLAERLLEDLEQGLDDLRAIADRQRGHVVAAATASFISHVLAPALQELARRFPGISVQLHEENTEGAARRLQAAELDFAITTLPAPAPGIATRPLLRDRFGLLCPKDHPLAGRATPLDWAVLRDFPLVGLSAQNGIRRLLEQDAQGVHALHGLRYEVSSVGALQSLVESRVGITAIPALAAMPMMRRTMVFLPLAPAVHRVVSLAYRPERSFTPAAREVLLAALRQLRRLRGEDVEILMEEAGFGRLPH